MVTYYFSLEKADLTSIGNVGMGELNFILNLVSYGDVFFDIIGGNVVEWLRLWACNPVCTDFNFLAALWI